MVDENPHWYGAILAPFANRVANGTFTFDGATHFLTRNECDDPSVRCDALHGFLPSYQMEIVRTNVSQHHASVTLSHMFDGSDPGYPFTVLLELEYSLNAEGAFHVDITATNVDLAQTRRPAPFTVGWHPYFLAEDGLVGDVSVFFDDCTDWLHVDMTSGAPETGTLLPTGLVSDFDPANLNPIGWQASTEPNERLPNYYDDEWKAASSACIERGIATRIASRSRAAVLEQSGAFRVTQMYTGGQAGWGTKTVAFEPMSGLADAFNNHDHLTTLSAHQSWRGRFGVRAEVL